MQNRRPIDDDLAGRPIGGGWTVCDRFARIMDGLGPFEPHPLIAVGVSGGPDSMALVLLADGWARSRGGAAIGLIVDHGLRSESSAEAARVAAWLEARAVAHEILPWAGAKPDSGIQAAARMARYRLLGEACARLGVLHLAVAHHADDQAETILLRRQRRSGEDGLAGMAADRSLGAVRLIRPLLGWPKAALTRFCADQGQPWIDDPSNRAARFARSGVRQRLQGDPALCDAALGEAQRAGLARAVRERDLALLLGRIAEIRPEGAVYLDHAELMVANADVGRAALAAALRTAGGGAYGPAAEAVARLHRAISAAAFRGASLAGCAIRLNRDRLMICREPGRIAPGQALTADRWTRWDGRFVLRVRGPIAHALTLGALGWLDFARLRRGIATSVPAIVAAGLPALRIGGDLVAAPGLGWAATAAPEVDHSFEPLWPLSSETFTVVSGGPDIMFDDGREQR